MQLDKWQFKVPIIAIIIGEGGSGGALLGCAQGLDAENPMYAVLSPEGFASIL